jgi:hypothetical protein
VRRVIEGEGVVFVDELENEWKQGSWLVLIDITMLNYQLVLLLLPPLPLNALVFYNSFSKLVHLIPL